MSSAGARRGKPRAGSVSQSPYAQSNSRLAPVGKLNASRCENLTQTGDGTGAYFFASLEANDCLGSNPRGDR